jgi:hypothetical protein
LPIVVEKPLSRTSRRVASRSDQRACFIPLPCPGLVPVQGFRPGPQCPSGSSPVAAPLPFVWLAHRRCRLPRSRRRLRGFVPWIDRVASF